MSWFQLDPKSLADRARADGSAVPSLATLITRGMVGFTIVSVAGFVPWGVFGRWFRQPGHGGELGMYVACALVFLILSGLFLHRLILGKGSLVRFYLLFTPAFTLYSIGWIVGWISLRGHLGSIVGLLAGTSAMGLIFALAFGAVRQTLAIITALFVLNSLGYFIGGVIEGALIKQMPTTAKLLWGVAYGIGFGAGLGIAFHLAQSQARALLAKD